MNLAGQWEELEAALPADWGDARLRLTIEEAARTGRASALLGPLQPFRAGPDSLSIRVARDGSAPSAVTVKRALARLDAERLHGVLSLVSVEARPAAPEAPPAPTLAESWDAAVASLPADWSDLLGEVELDSSDYLERCALHLAPLNPRRGGDRLAFRFRSASRFGYGASPWMVRRCLERCDDDRIRGRVAVLRALSDTQPVGTQGPVWQIDGEMV
jgi:hypothetical protein